MVEKFLIPIVIQRSDKSFHLFNGKIIVHVQIIIHKSIVRLRLIVFIRMNVDFNVTFIWMYYIHQHLDGSCFTVPVRTYESSDITFRDGKGHIVYSEASTFFDTLSNVTVFILLLLKIYFDQFY